MNQILPHIPVITAAAVDGARAKIVEGRHSRAGIAWALGLATAIAWPVHALAADAAVATKTVKPGTFCEIQDAKACQEAVTPQLVLERFKSGNLRFAAGKGTQRNTLKSVKATAAGQYPLATVVSCIDSRAPAELVFDQGIGDLFNARVAGNIVNDDILGSLEFASKVAGSKLIIVLGHTSCGAIKGACDDAKLGNLTGLIAKIKPAVASVPADGQDRSSKNYSFVQKVADMNVNMTVKAIRDRSPVLKEMEDKGEIRIVGAMYDVATGKVSWFDEAQAKGAAAGTTAPAPTSGQATAKKI